MYQYRRMSIAHEFVEEIAKLPRRESIALDLYSMDTWPKRTTTFLYMCAQNHICTWCDCSVRDNNWTDFEYASLSRRIRHPTTLYSQHWSARFRKRMYEKNQRTCVFQNSSGFISSVGTPTPPVWRVDDHLRFNDAMKTALVVLASFDNICKRDMSHMMRTNGEMAKKT